MSGECFKCGEHTLECRCQVKELCKSNIVHVIYECLSLKKDLDKEYKMKGSSHSVKIIITHHEPEIFTDSKGVKWMKVKE